MLPMHNIERLIDNFKKLSSQKQYMEKTVESKKKSLIVTNAKIKDLEEVHSIWIQLAKKIQVQTTAEIEAIVTTAIQSVYQRNYRFKLRFEEKRNNIICTPLVIEGDKEYSPKDSMGGGMLDIIGFALRISLHAMQNPKTRNVFILDEPFKFCGDLTTKAAIMLKKLSKKLNFQVILVTHNEDLKEICDKTWFIQKNKNSKVRQLINAVNRKIKRRQK